MEKFPSQGSSRKRLILALACLLAALRGAPALVKNPKPGPESLNNIAAIRNLSPAEAGTHVPIRLRAVVTYYDARSLMLLIHDRTGGIFVQTTKPLPIVAGSVVEVAGFSDPDFTNTIARSSVREIRRGSRPEPKRVSIKFLLSGDADCEYVTITGKIRTAFLVQEDKVRFLELRLESQGKVIDVQIADFPPDVQTGALIDRVVTLQGLADGSFNDQQQLVGIVLNVQSLDDVRVLHQASQDPYQLPVRPLAQLLRYRTGTKLGMRAHVRGTVTYLRPNRLLILRDGNLAIPVHSQQTARVAVGDVIDVIGFPAFGETTPVIEDADYRVASSGSGQAPLVPRKMAPTNAQAGIFDSQLVSTEAKLLTVTSVTGKYTLALSSNSTLFSAVLEGVNVPERLKTLRPGSLLRVTGVCSVDTAGMWRMVQDFRILMRSPADVEVLQTPSWDVQSLIYLLVGLVFAVVATFAWVAVLRHRVALQSLAMQEVQLEEAAREKRRAHHQETRNRILESVNRRDPLEPILGAIASLPEQQYPALGCVIHLMADDGNLTPVLESCSTSEMREFVLRETPEGEEPLWVQAARLAKAVSVGEAWSWPILGADAAVRGTVTAVKREAVPDGALTWVADVTTQMAALAIDNRSLYDGLRHRSLHDPLTGMPNRDYLEAQLHAALETARAAQQHLAITYIDLDKFKQVNDVYGHDVGDDFLRIAARRFRASLRQGDMLGRVGGDEFIGFFPAIGGRDEAEEIRHRLVEQLRDPLRLSESQSLPCSASIGVALFPEDGETLEELRRKADEAMYKAKLDRNSKQAPAPHGEKLSAIELRSAMDAHRLRAYYQPIFAMDGQLFGFEALLRIVDQNGDLVEPDRFIETAEESGMIVAIGRWILQESCRQALAWESRFGRGLTISVNVSPRQFADGAFVDEVLNLFQDMNLPPTLLQLELTESTMLRDLHDTIAQVHRLRRLGVRIALDDFGTGHSSLSVLHHLPVDVLKVDRSFVKSMGATTAGAPVIDAIFSLANSLGAFTIAEGIEHGAQIAALQKLGCGALQGFGLARPMPAEAIDSRLPEWLTPASSIEGRLVDPEAAPLQARLECAKDVELIGTRT